MLWTDLCCGRVLKVSSQKADVNCQGPSPSREELASSAILQSVYLHTQTIKFDYLNTPAVIWMFPLDLQAVALYLQVITVITHESDAVKINLSFDDCCCRQCVQPTTDLICKQSELSNPCISTVRLHCACTSCTLTCVQAGHVHH